MRLWSKMVDEGLHEGVTEISFSAMFRERMRRMPEELREARFRNIGDPRRRDRFKSTYELGVRSPFVLHGIAAYERAFKMLERHVAESGPWILGASATLADINLMPYAARLDYLGLLELWIDDRPRVRDWWVQAQPMAELQVRAPRPHHRDRARGNADPWTHDPGRRSRSDRGATARRASGMTGR